MPVLPKDSVPTKGGKKPGRTRGHLPLNRPSISAVYSLAAVALLLGWGSSGIAAAQTTASKNPAPQGAQHGDTSVTFNWQNPAGHRLFPQAVKVPPTRGPRIGEVGPLLTLPDAKGLVRPSGHLLGKSAQLILLPPPGLRYSPQLVEAARRAETKGLVCQVVQSGKTAAPEPFVTLRDESGAMATYWSGAALLTLDRAGWLRDYLPLDNLGSAENAATQLEFALARAEDPTPALAVGKVAPDFSFPDSRGNTRRVSALRGRRNLVLTFFPKCFTGRCQSHLSSLRDTYAAFQAADTEVWAVSVDPPGGDKGQIAFAESLGVTFPLLPDTGRNISLLYDAADHTEDLATRQTILIDKDGIVRLIDRDFSVATHGPDTLRAIQRLQTAANVSGEKPTP